MKKFKLISVYIIGVMVIGSGCSIQRDPETEFNDDAFWNTETDLVNAANRMYEQLDANWIDNRADDATNQTIDQVSTGTRSIPNTSGDWNDRYDEIFTANNILAKAPRAAVSTAILNRYLAEARFFRAFAYSSLVKKYGDVPLVLIPLTIESPELYMGRTPRAVVMDTIYADLDFAAQWLPARAALPAAQYGRVTKSSAWALKARMGLYEGTRAKFANEQGWENDLTIAVDAATNVMAAGHVLFPNFQGLFIQAGEGAANTENIFVKIFGVTNANLIVGHNNSRDLENGRMAPTRNLLRQFLYSDGLPAWTTENAPSSTRSPLFVAEGAEPSYNTMMQNRDPRMQMTVFVTPEVAYQGPWIPKTSLGSRTGYAPKKGFSVIDQTINGAATVDKMLIRYAEVLLTYAEAKYELTESISDADLELTINKVRARAGFTVKLTNAFVTTNNLDMRDEIRRERTVELALEGFRYDDLIRWRTAERVMPKEILGAKFNAAEWVGTNQTALNLNSDLILIVEPAANRTFRADRDYLYPVPFNEINLSGGNVVQNPNWQ